MKKIIYILITNCLLLIANCYGQPSITWNRLYNGYNTYKDYGDAICDAGNNNIFIAGTSQFIEQIWEKIFLLKINSYGDTIWTKYLTVNGGGAEAYSIIKSENGGCLITGFASNKYLLKVDSSGNIEWEFASPAEYAAYWDVKCTSSKEYILAGNLAYYQGGSIIKLDSTGHLIWEKTYPGYYFRQIQFSLDNTYLIAGFLETYYAFVVKLDTSGNIILSKNLRINNYPTGETAFEKDSNKYILSGNYNNGIQLQPYSFILDDNLKVLDTNFIIPLKSEILESMKILRNGNYVWTLLDENIHDTSFNRLIITDKSGNIIKEKMKFIYSSYTNDMREEFTDIYPVDNGDIIFLGSARYEIPSYWDICALRTDSNLNFPNNIIGINKNEEQQIPSSNLKCYPNPSNNSTTVYYRLNHSANIKLILYDLTGRVVNTLENTFHFAGEYERTMNTENIASGIYVLSLISDYEKFNLKISIIK